MSCEGQTRAALFSAKTPVPRQQALSTRQSYMKDCTNIFGLGPGPSPISPTVSPLICRTKLETLPELVL